MTSEPVTLRERPNGRMVDDFLPSLIVAGGHGLCAGCGEPIALRSVVETVEDLGLVERSVSTSAPTKRRIDASISETARPIAISNARNGQTVGNSARNSRTGLPAACFRHVRERDRSGIRRTGTL